MWDLEKDENYVLSLKASEVADPSETLTCIAYSHGKGDNIQQMSSSWISLKSRVFSLWLIVSVIVLHSQSVYFMQATS